MTDGGIERLRARFRALPQKVREATQKAALKSAEETASAMRHLAQSSRDTGDLIESIEVTPSGQTTPAYSQPGGSTIVPDGAAAITVGNSEVRYPHLLEHGTTKAPAQPFFWPAVRSLRKRNVSRIKRAGSKAVRDYWGAP